jgi:hypothetical protein
MKKKEEEAKPTNLTKQTLNMSIVQIYCHIKLIIEIASCVETIRIKK